MYPGSSSSENLEVLTEKVGTLGLQNFRKNRSVAAKKTARKARLTEAPTEDSDSGRPQPPRNSQPQILQEPETPWTQKKTKKESTENGPSTSGPESSESKGPSQGPSKRQRPSEGTTESGQAKYLKQAGHPSYARATREGIRMAIVCDGYLEIQVSREKFVSIQRAIGGHVGELPGEEFPQAD